MIITHLDLETVTPMFLRGSDNRTPELRPPPFKSLFRYWWRTVQDCEENSLRNAEADWFGSTDGKAPFSIRIPPGTASLGKPKKFNPLPHKSGAGIDAFDIGKPFQLHLITKTGADATYYQQIAKLGFLLGGIGARSRRGFGTIREINWTFSDIPSLQDDILKTLNAVAKVERFQIKRDFRINNRIFEIIESKRRSHYPPEFPVIQRIFFGKLTGNLDHLLEDIGHATSDAKKYNKDDTLGGGVPRMASPVIVRVQIVNSQYIPIVTQLYSPYPSYTGRDSWKKPSNIPSKQLKFINDII